MELIIFREKYLTKSNEQIKSVIWAYGLLVLREKEKLLIF